MIEKIVKTPSNLELVEKVNEVIDKSGAAIIYDQVIRTQREFEALIASPTWLGAVSVCFVGDGGKLKFTRSDGKGCLIPPTVKQIQGMNGATIDVTEFVYSETNKAALWYKTLLDTDDYWMNGLAVACTSTGDGYGFYNCAQLTHCSSSTSSGSNDYGFFCCTQLTHCSSSSISNSSNAYGFRYCTQLSNCISNADSESTNSNHNANGFFGCTQLLNCTGEARGHHYLTSSFGFFECTQLSNCDGSSFASNITCGFFNCEQLSNCIGTGLYGGDYAFGFSQCTQLSNCIGTGYSMTEGYGFYDCSYLNGCKQGDDSSSTDFLGGSNIYVDTLTVAAN